MLSPDLIWQANSCQWTAMHVAACGPTSPNVWKVLLHDASPAELSGNRTNMGQTVLQLFLSYQLQPVGWQKTPQAAQQAFDLNQAIRRVLGSTKQLQRFKEWWQKNQQTQDDDSFLVNMEPCLIQFWQVLGRLCRAHHSVDENPSILAIVAQHGCPKVLAELLTEIEPLDLYHDNRLPLHHWAAAASCHDSTDLAEVLLVASPSSIVSQELTTLRTPLQVAAAAGQALKVLYLWSHAPSLLSEPDPVTALPLVALVAWGMSQLPSNAYCSSQNNNQHKFQLFRIGRSHDTNPHEQRHQGGHQQQLEANQLTALYTLLQLDPTAML